MAKIDLKGNPFFLDDDGVKWVEETLGKMDIEEKVGQVFCPMGFTSDENALNHIIGDRHVGGIMYRPGPKSETRQTHEKIQNMAKIPLLIAANTECGGDGLCVEGTSFGKPMAVAATDNEENAYHMGLVACSEGAAAGLNWSFAPIVDIDYEFHNPITNVRTFGSDPDRVLKMGLAYLKGAKEAGVAVSIKHFPGDGTDERDQHLLTSVNSFDTKKWDETYGKVYGELIKEGAQTVMVGHIAQPSYVKAINPEATHEETLLPATLSKEILTGLLREKLGFNGLISTDATPMIGFCSAMKRKDAIPAAINAGCDMILFNKDLDEDYGYLLDAVNNNIVSMERLDEAITRILGVKASLSLHVKQKENRLVPGEESLDKIGCEKHREWARTVADESITLVRDRDSILPISPAKYKRIYLNVIQKDLSPENPVVRRWKENFEKEGFEVTVRDRRTTIEPENFAGINMTPEKGKLLHEMYRSVEEFRQESDLYVYIANVENASNNTTARLNWNVIFGLGDDAPWFAKEMPSLFISTANPYHLFDAPMMGTFINAYCSNEMYDAAIMDKVMGRSDFKGKSPVDPFCGKDYLK